MRSDAYWAARAVRRMHEYQKQADKTADDIAQVYIKTTNYINNEIRKIFNAFQLDNGLSEAEARRILNHLPDSETLNSIRSVISGIADPAHRQELLSLLNAPAYAHRIQRLEQLQADIDRQAEQLGSFEQSVTQQRYVELADEAYNRTIFDLQKGTGIGFSFSRMPRSRIEEVLRNNWSGKLFSERIWGRSEEINRRLKEELLTGFMTGRSYRKTAQAIEECMEVGAMEARRLVRTESTYVANMAEAESYKECGIERYKFVATLDMRTSAVCQALDGQTFPVSEGMPGTNMPPMHPWCRSTTIAVIDDAVTEGWTRIARDPETGKTYRVPADMTYAEWKDKYVDKSAEGGIINNRGENNLNVTIDKFTPCLENAKTGELVATSYTLIDTAELKKLRGWKFDWTHPSLNGAEIYKLTLKDGDEIQGLVALTEFDKDRAVYVNIAESAPENIGQNKQYNGVGGHLFAIAARRSVDLGYGGFMFMDAKNLELVEHYQKTLGATLLGRPHPYRMFVDEDAAKKLLEVYTLEEGK